MIYQGVVPYKYLCHDIFHVFVSKYSENKSRVCAFVHRKQLKQSPTGYIWDSFSIQKNDGKEYDKFSWVEK